MDALGFIGRLAGGDCAPADPGCMDHAVWGAPPLATGLFLGGGAREGGAPRALARFMHTGAHSAARGRSNGFQWGFVGSDFAAAVSE